MIFCQTKVLTDIIQQTVNGKGDPTKDQSEEFDMN